MKVNQLLVLLAAPASVFTNAIEDYLLSGKYGDDDSYADAAGDDDDFISTGPDLGFLQEAMSQDLALGYTAAMFNGTTTTLQPHQEHGRQLCPLCVPAAVIVVELAIVAFSEYHRTHRPVIHHPPNPNHAGLTLDKAKRSFHDKSKQHILVKLQDTAGTLVDPVHYLNFETTHGQGSCSGAFPAEEAKAVVKVFCVDPDSKKLVFKVKARKRIDSGMKLILTPMFGRRELSQHNDEYGDIIDARDYFGTYWELKDNTAIEKDHYICEIVNHELPPRLLLDSSLDLRTQLLWDVFKEYVTATIPQIINAIKALVARTNVRKLQPSVGRGFAITSCHTGHGALYVSIYSYGTSINLGLTKHGGDGTLNYIHNRLITKIIPQGQSQGPMQTALVSLAEAGWVRIVLHHDGNFGPGWDDDDYRFLEEEVYSYDNRLNLGGSVGIAPRDGQRIFCFYPEYMHGNQCAWTVLDDSTTEAWLYIY